MLVESLMGLKNPPCVFKTITIKNQLNVQYKPIQHPDQNLKPISDILYFGVKTLMTLISSSSHHPDMIRHNIIFLFCGLKMGNNLFTHIGWDQTVVMCYMLYNPILNILCVICTAHPEIMHSSYQTVE